MVGEQEQPTDLSAHRPNFHPHVMQEGPQQSADDRHQGINMPFYH